ncbi:MAG: rubredoxin [Clostridiales bacterium]|nr:rubredoxin [Clostridiales bacterium]
MKQYVCSVCGYVYDEAKGIPGSIAPGTRWEEIPDAWVCPLCGASKAEFKEQGAAPAAKKAVPVPAMKTEPHEFSALEMSVLCSNLARGCEKQYKPEEQALFAELAAYFKAAAAKDEKASVSGLLDSVKKDLEEGYPSANTAAGSEKDRGALRALVWGEKVSNMLKSILTRYEKEGDAMLENTGVHLCTICGFIYLGDAAPDLCPVCKVPAWKFETIEGRA